MKKELRKQVVTLLYDEQFEYVPKDVLADELITLIRTAALEEHGLLSKAQWIEIGRTQALDEVKDSILKAYLNLGDVYTSKDMYDDTMQAIDNLRGK